MNPHGKALLQMTSSLSPLGCEDHEWIPVTWAVIRSICQSIESYLESQSINRIQLIVHLGTPRAVQHHHIATLLEGGYRPGLARSTTRRAGRPRCSTSVAGSQNKSAVVHLWWRKTRTPPSSGTGRGSFDDGNTPPLRRAYKALVPGSKNFGVPEGKSLGVR